MKKSTLMRLGVCTLTVIAMVAMLEGCAKKKASTETTTEKTTGSTSTAHMAMAGTYSATMANGMTSLMLNTDMTASLSMKPVAEAPAQVENGTWAAGSMPGEVAVTFSKSPTDSTMSMTLNFMAMGDTLMLNNGETVGMTGLKLVKQK